MENRVVYLLFSGVAALVSVAMWLDYFRKIDVFEKEKTFHLLIALFIGACTPLLSLEVYSILHQLGFEDNGGVLQKLLYAIFAIGLNEEFSKILGVIVVFRLFKKQINEPIDYLIYAGVVALGFSLVENYNYFYNHSVKIITSRTFFSALEHIINTTIIVYGFSRYKLFSKGSLFLNTIVACTLAVGSHALFDFFLIEGILGFFTTFISTIIYLVGINFWIQMLNNANNFSDSFDYDKVPIADSLVYRLLFWYALTLFIAFFNNFLMTDIRFSMQQLISSLLSDSLIFLLVILRISRFRILKGRYLKVEIALPFYVTKNGDEDFMVPLLNLPIKIRGENTREHVLTKYLNRKVKIASLSPNLTMIGNEVEATIDNKYLLFDDIVVYTAAINDAPQLLKYVLKPRMGPLPEANVVENVFGLFTIKLNSANLQISEIHYKDLHFEGWVQIKAIEAPL